MTLNQVLHLDSLNGLVWSGLVVKQLLVWAGASLVVSHYAPVDILNMSGMAHWSSVSQRGRQPD